MNRTFCFVVVIGLALVVFACTPKDAQKSINIHSIVVDSASLKKDKIQINFMLDSFNLAAAQADYEKYFDFFADDATFLGTDATENWKKEDFMRWVKPFFDRGSVWDFTSMERNIYFLPSGDVAWFDELLNTQMKICRGSGVLIKKNNEWKIQQYVLSMTVPNSKTNAVVALKSGIEDSLIGVFSKKAK